MLIVDTIDQNASAFGVFGSLGTREIRSAPARRSVLPSPLSASRLRSGKPCSKDNDCHSSLLLKGGSISQRGYTTMISRTDRFSDRQQGIREAFLPGPGSYNHSIANQFVRRRVSTSFGRSRCMKSKSKKLPPSPGPGHYYPFGVEERKAWDKNFNYSFNSTGRENYRQRPVFDSQAAPGSYEVGKSIDALHNYGNTTGRPGAVFQSKIDRLKEMEPKTVTPSPCKYDIEVPEEPYRNRPCSVFCSSLDRFGNSPYEKENEVEPGPGFYEPKIDRVKETNIAAFQSRLPRFSEDNAKAEQPGPAYYNPRTLSKKKCFHFNLDKKWTA
mmetsp:Transcript_9251/g.13898  ORF Transcript_9251/g.13898 Transcript_9251/m.13898 type:complete len:327 (-) Transcript_9251:98-1078(-)